MSHRSLALRGRIITFLLLAMVLGTLTVGASAETARDVGAPSGSPAASSQGPQPDAGAQPDKITRPTGAKPGVYYIDYGGNPLNPATYPVDGAVRFYSWSLLNGSDGGYNWSEVDGFINSRKAIGLGAAIMITTYDGSTAGDIRSTPNYVIKQPNAVLAATIKDSAGVETPHYASYWRRAGYNANFEYSPHDYAWTLTGNAAVVPFPPAPVDPTAAAGGYAAQLGGVDGSEGALVHGEERIPAIPSGLTPAKTVYVRARINIQSTDPNDRLYVDFIDQNNAKQTVDITAQPYTSGEWKDYEFDISAFAPEKRLRVQFRAVTDASNTSTYFVDNIGLFVRHLVPNYWPDTDAERTYYKAYKKFIDAFGARYKTNLDLQFVAIGSGVYGENQPTQDEYNHVVEKYGKLTSVDWIEYVNTLSAAYANAFATGDPDQPGPGRHILLQYAPTYKSIDEREQTTNYAASRGVGLSSNFLSPDWVGAYRGDNDGSFDPIRRYSNQVPIAFESYDMDLCNPLVTYWALLSGLDKHVDYLRADPTLIRNANGTLTANAPLYDWASNYIGRTLQNTPKVWSVMREHRNPTLNNCRPGGIYYPTGTAGSTWPQLGNYNFWLYQIDSVAGGRTVPETNDKSADARYSKDPVTGAAATNAGLGNCWKSYREDYYGPDYPCFHNPYNPNLPALGGQDATLYNVDHWTGQGKEAYVVRRTDQNADPTKNNPFMFFRIDDGYVDGTRVYEAKITVKYFDIGTDKWTLKYHSSTGEKTASLVGGGTVVQKTGTKALKTAEFVVYDGRFKNGLAGSTDFYIDSRDPSGVLDGNEWVHIVEFERVGDSPNPIDTATPTATPTETATPTVTPTSTPSTGVVSGLAYHDVNGNNKRDAGEPGLAGAEMVLDEFISGETRYTALSAADGTFRFGSVEPAQYTLSERTAPPGYKRNTTFALMFQVKANQEVDAGLVAHVAEPTPTPTATATATPTATPTGTATAQMSRVYLPVLIK